MHSQMRIRPKTPYERAKRVADVVISLAGLIVLAPLLLLVAAVVRICLGAPVIFRQQRPGLGGRPFTLYKFRTMTDARDVYGRTLSNDARITRVGRFLRKSSLDELPELWNVLKGDMSIVGPRPLRMEYLPLYSPMQARRHEVRPGITGWAQVNGRNAISWEERFALDVWYVDNRSTLLDIKIMIRTISEVLRAHGVTATESEFMPPFRGSIEHEHHKRAMMVVSDAVVE